ncbi:MAG: class I SAM-dependent methyltransferase [Rhodoferax sp.]
MQKAKPLRTAPMASLWPLSAVLVWSASWGVYLGLATWGWPSPWPMVLGFALGIILSLLGATRPRQIALALGFPLSWLLLASASVPAWSWLIPLALALLIYPAHSWRDAPLFPTPLNALQALAGLAPLPQGAVILDAGSGLGDGLRALRKDYPQARLWGIDSSWLLRVACALRCPWARVWHGDIWNADWRPCHMVYLFQRPESMARAATKAQAELQPGAWLVSLEFEATEWVPTAVAQASENRPLWLYQQPLRRR